MSYVTSKTGTWHRAHAPIPWMFTVFSDKPVEEKMGFGVNFKSDISLCGLGG